MMLGPRKGPFRDLVLKNEQCLSSIINLRCIFYTDVFDHTIYVLVFSQYYKRLFPYSQYARWLQYGNVDKNYMANRLNFYWTAEWSTPITSLCWCLIILIPGSFRSLLLTTSTSATWASQELRILKRRWSKGLTPPSPSFQYTEYKP